MFHIQKVKENSFLDHRNGGFQGTRCGFEGSDSGLWPSAGCRMARNCATKGKSVKSSKNSERSLVSAQTCIENWDKPQGAKPHRRWIVEHWSGRARGENIINFFLFFFLLLLWLDFLNYFVYEIIIQIYIRTRIFQIPPTFVPLRTRRSTILGSRYLAHDLTDLPVPTEEWGVVRRHSKKHKSAVRASSLQPARRPPPVLRQSSTPTILESNYNTSSRYGWNFEGAKDTLNTINYSNGERWSLFHFPK